LVSSPYPQKTLGKKDMITGKRFVQYVRIAFKDGKIDVVFLLFDFGDEVIPV